MHSGRGLFLSGLGLTTGRLFLHLGQILFAFGRSGDAGLVAVIEPQIASPDLQGVFAPGDPIQTIYVRIETPGCSGNVLAASYKTTSLKPAFSKARLMVLCMVSERSAFCSYALTAMMRSTA